MSFTGARVSHVASWRLARALIHVFACRVIEPRRLATDALTPRVAPRMGRHMVASSESIQRAVSAGSGRGAARGLEDPTPALPRLLVGAALILWGAGVELLVVAVPIALAYELAPLIPWRWRFSPSDFNRLVDLSAVLFVVAALYQFDERAVHGVYGLLQWLPGLLALLLLCQRYSALGRVPLAALFLRVRRAVARGEADPERGIDFALPYFAACLLSASASGMRTSWLFFAIAALAFWALVGVRGRRYHIGVWIVNAMLIVALAYATQYGIKSARRALEPFMLELMRDYMSRHRDPFKHRTAMGELGQLKASNRIELRVRPGADGAAPDRLIEATYRQFSRNIWVTGTQKLNALVPTNGGVDWQLFKDPNDTAGPAESDAEPDAHPNADSGRSIQVSRYLTRGRGLLAVPEHAWQITGLGVDGLSRHPMGALQVERGPDWIEYTAHIDPAQSKPVPPSALDLHIPREYRVSLSKWLSDRGIALRIHQLGNHIDALSREQGGRVIAAVMRGLADGYRYSLDLPSRTEALPLKRFLHESRAGHCEFFATSTVLLLRAAGVPARYETGYAISEWDASAGTFVVRRRHAHAWASAYINGQWTVVDTTPSAWLSLEDEAAPWWSGLYDILSATYHLYSRWRWRESEDDTQPWLLWAALPLIGYLVWRLRAERVSTRGIADQQTVLPAQSPLEQLLGDLEQRVSSRAEGETLRRWLQRVQQQHRAGVAGVPDVSLLLSEALPIHLRLRFDPDADEQLATRALTTVCARWREDAWDDLNSNQRRVS